MFSYVSFFSSNWNWRKFRNISRYFFLMKLIVEFGADHHSEPRWVFIFSRLRLEQGRDYNLSICFPNVWDSLPRVRHNTRVFLATFRGKVHIFGQVVIPVFPKRQVFAFSFGHRLVILEELDGDQWRVEIAHMTDQGVGLVVLSSRMTVHLNHGRSDFRQWRADESQKNNADKFPHDFTFCRAVLKSSKIHNITVRNTQILKSKVKPDAAC